MTRDDIIRMAREAGIFVTGEAVWKLCELVAAAEREVCAEKTGEFARKWWSIHCASNKHMETTRKAHDDFCALQIAIRGGKA